MAYVLPQVLVFQEFTIAPVAINNPLRAHVSGPHAFLLRFTEEDEQSLGRLGFYDNLLDTAYVWPNRPAGGIVDASYVKLFVKDALLRYFSDSVSAGSVITKTDDNRVRSADLNFAENTDTYPRSAEFLDRDVQIGDIAKVRALDVDLNPVTLWTYVAGIEGDEVAATIDAAESDTDNVDSQAAVSSTTKISGPENCIDMTEDATSYDGLPSGFVDETYDILVTESSSGGDLTTATIRVLSASGTDDQAAVTPAALDSPTDIGTRGLTVTFTHSGNLSCSISADTDDVAPVDLIAGQRWRVVVQSAHVAPTATSGGTYTGEESTTYIVEVTKGGVFSDEPEISVTTTTGTDISGPTVVSAAATDVAVGTFGVTVSFDAVGLLGLRKGDRFYIEVVGVHEGPMRTLILGHAMDPNITDGTEVSLDLFILKDQIEIPQNRAGLAPQTNWDLSETEITVNDGITAFDVTWTDAGVPVALPVISESTQDYGVLFVEYRAWLADLCEDVFTIVDVGELDAQISGPLHPDNPLKWGVFKALTNANGVEVKYTAVCDPDDDDSWANVLEKLLGRDDVYGLAPLTRRRTVLDLYHAHVNAMSTPTQALWRTLWVNLEGMPTIPIVSDGSEIPNHIAATTSDGEIATATILDDPDTSGTQYTIVFSSSNAQFVTNGVRPGDILRTLYAGDGFGNVTYSEFVIDAVLAENKLRLLTGPSAAVNVAAKIEVWRNLTATEESAEIAVQAGAWGDRRVRAVWPDQIESFGTIQEGYHLCAALAALAGGILPHRGLTNIAVAGFSDVSRSARKFNRSQLDTMAESGTLIVTQDLITGAIFVRHGLTTGDQDDLNQKEEMITRNLDSVSYRMKQHFAPFIGQANVTPVLLVTIGTELNNIIDILKTENFTPTLGGQIVDATVQELRIHATLRDRIVVKLLVDLPEALNNLEISLLV